MEGSQRDGLDEVISGVQSGDIQDEDEGNPNPLADRFKCGQVHEGNQQVGPNDWLASKMDELLEMYTSSKDKNDWQVNAYTKGEVSSSIC